MEPPSKDQSELVVTAAPQYHIAVPPSLPPVASRQALQAQNAELRALVELAAAQIVRDHAQMVLMDLENGSLCQQAFAKEKKRQARFNTTHARHLTAEENIDALARAEWEGRMQVLFREEKETFDARCKALLRLDVLEKLRRKEELRRLQEKVREEKQLAVAQEKAAKADERVRKAEERVQKKTEETADKVKKAEERARKKAEAAAEKQQKAEEKELKKQKLVQKKQAAEEIKAATVAGCKMVQEVDTQLFLLQANATTL
ncbi:hypothetical protein PHLCEN_2v10246 [Hermanssonia centrifuga]|uniref:Uncharacterized protein n=1 Tax=Hermanssonia centrifuga TaxID=98765 RepID=A0A2R6NNF3_9APHY|nr:hypothetical protein PHLCEN_2v10246 [Hermanssonia centrifuga]